jgi:hypothetical protein
LVEPTIGRQAKLVAEAAALHLKKNLRLRNILGRWGAARAKWQKWSILRLAEPSKPH